MGTLGVLLLCLLALGLIGWTVVRAIIAGVRSAIDFVEEVTPVQWAVVIIFVAGVLCLLRG